MTKTVLSKDQLQHARGIFSDALQPYGGLYQAEVPRPSFTAFATWAVAHNILPDANSGFTVRPGTRLTNFPGLRGIGIIPQRIGQPKQFPAVVLEDGTRIGVLGGQADLTFSPLQQLLLDNIYLNHRANVLDHPNTTTPAGFGGHAVIAASALANGTDAHGVVHSFAPKTFGSEAAKKGVFDIAVTEQQTFAVRSAVFDLARVAFIAADYQQPQSQDSLGAGITGEAANVAYTLAATLSNPARGAFNVGRNLAAMHEGLS